MKIYAPVKDANGIYASIMFVNGVGETDNPVLIEWFKAHGYKIEENTNVSYNAPAREVGGNESVEETEPDFEAMSPVELRNWARENGYGGKIKNTRNKDKLIEILRG